MCPSHLTIGQIVPWVAIGFIVTLTGRFDFWGLISGSTGAGARTANRLLRLGALLGELESELTCTKTGTSKSLLKPRGWQ